MSLKEYDAGSAASTAAADRASEPAALRAWPFPKSGGRNPRGRRLIVDDEETTTKPADPLPGEATLELPPMGDRIQVDQVSLYTDPSRNTIELVSLDDLQESPFNPRVTYNQQALQALAETIRGVGVMQPLLVRPLSVDGLLKFNRENPRHEGERPRYEVVYGHRRRRAAKLAGETHVPVIVRELKDNQAAQLQAIENVQRKDLDAIEEALGYQHYITVHKVSKDQLAQEIGLSRSHVYARLKLLTLPEEVRAAHLAGEIAIDVALAIARLHTPGIQAKALASLRSQHHDLEDGGKRSVRNIKRFLREKFTLDLDDALFEIDDEQLLEGAGACTTCPKRSGNAPEYHDMTVEDGRSDYRYASEDGNANLCTDPDCFDAKKKAHLAVEAAKLSAQGKSVIGGNKARAIVSAQGEIKGGYIPMKDVAGLLAGKGKKKKGSSANAGGPAPVPQLQAVIVQDPRTGKTHEVVRADDVKAAGLKLKERKPTPGSRDFWAKENERRQAEHEKNVAKAKEDRRVNYAVLGAVRQAAAGQTLPAEAVRLVATVALAGVGYEDQAALCSIYCVESWKALHQKVSAMEPQDLTTLLLDCALVQNVNVEHHTVGRQPHALLWAAEHYGVDVEEIRSDLTNAPPADTVTKDLLNDGGDNPDHHDYDEFCACNSCQARAGAAQGDSEQEEQ